MNRNTPDPSERTTRDTGAAAAAASPTEAASAAAPEVSAPAPRPRPRGLGWQAKAGVTVIALAALGALFWPRGDGSFEAPGGFLVDGNGRPQTMGPRMEPVTLVHFWATWCPPCITEIPALDRLRDDLAARPDFGILMIAVQDDVEKVETFVGEARAGLLYDPDWDVAHRYGTRQLPESYLVVRGQVVEKWEGEVDWDDPRVRARIEEALAGVESS